MLPPPSFVLDDDAAVSFAAAAPTTITTTTTDRTSEEERDDDDGSESESFVPPALRNFMNEDELERMLSSIDALEWTPSRIREGLDHDEFHRGRDDDVGLDGVVDMTGVSPGMLGGRRLAMDDAADGTPIRRCVTCFRLPRWW